MRPGFWTRRMIENAVTDLPLPDSPTSPSVSPLRISNDTSSTATRGPNTVRRFSTLRSGCDMVPGTIGDCGMVPGTLVEAHFSVFAEHSAECICDFADGGPRFDRGNDRRHEVVRPFRGVSDLAERGLPCRLIARRPHRLHAFLLLLFQVRVDLENFD